MVEEVSLCRRIFDEGTSGGGAGSLIMQTHIRCKRESTETATVGRIDARDTHIIRKMISKMLVRTEGRGGRKGCGSNGCSLMSDTT